jgi:hypothetical protein
MRSDLRQALGDRGLGIRRAGAPARDSRLNDGRIERLRVIAHNGFNPLPARTPAEAVQAYSARISRILSCLTTAHVDVGGGYAPSAAPHALIMAGNDAVALWGARRDRRPFLSTTRPLT